MHSNMINTRKATSTTTPDGSTEIADDLSPFLRQYKDGRVERLVSSNFVPASEAPGANGVATRDVVIDPTTGVSARLFLNVGAAANGSNNRRLPVIVYFHGGGLCTGSAFSKLFHRYAASLSARAAALVVSVDYRLAPEHPVPAAFDDAWAALRWVTKTRPDDPWLVDHADRASIFLAGESAGANIAHNVAARAAAASDDDVHIEGMILLHPFFWGPDRLPSETEDHHRQHKTLLVPEKLDKLWPFLTGGMASNDDPRADPTAEVVASVACQRALVAVASKDLARHRGRRYAAWLQRHGRWCREVTFVESEGEDHAFHLYRPARATAVELMDSVVEFIHNTTTTPAPPNTAVLHDPAVLNLHASRKAVYCRATLGYGIDQGQWHGRHWSIARRALVVIGTGKAVPRFGQMMGTMKIH
ncbi:hypothetical protein QOZ80_5AG0407330 [Eleusine coracana subsp. coracana]|nr:hypothetical protein QOZ80_5AG0407330 [Eleusine coracana subsp. coracana]